ncbi:unnamed protein product [Allacma fusca]|uniref:Kazal-like domain-containing protein n=1 Tax=Allacma fusca TaxID=39272 RepID=A0A8J2KTQ7_9HEXA|nr:unnamed protein product [Allacma fusca]
MAHTDLDYWDDESLLFSCKKGFECWENATRVPEPVCSSDNVTFPNRAAMKCEGICNPEVKKDYDGECKA